MIIITLFLTIFVLLITLITYLAVGESLKFGLNGDDWQALYFYIIRFTTFGSHFDIKNFSTGVSNYTFTHIIMGLIYRVFSFNPFPYYLFSMIFRIIAALSFYLAVNSVTKNKMAAYLSSIFFAVMYTGIETTNWVFNMNTYISISLFNLFLHLYYSKDFSVFSKRSILSSLVLTASFMITQNRMHGLLFLIPILVFFRIRYFKKVFNKFFMGVTILYLPIFLFRLLTRSSNDIAYTPYFLQSLTQWKILILSLFSSIGNAIVPEWLYDFFKITNQSKTILIASILFLLYLFISKRISNNKKYFSVLIFLFTAVIFLIIPLLVYGSPTILSSDHRYLIIPGAYILIAFAILLADLWQSSKQIYKIISGTLIILIIIINFVSLRNYFNFLANNGRLAKDIDKHFSFILSNTETPNKNTPVAFLFTPDDPFKLYNSITFGFSYHMMLTDKRFGLDIQKSPFAVDNFESLVDVVSSEDSLELKRYGYKRVKIPLQNIYFFSLQNDVLTNITPQGRTTLKAKFPAL